MRQSPLLTVLLLAVVLLLATSLPRAETSRPHGRPAEVQAEDLLEGLAGRVALTPAELAAVRPILVDHVRRQQEMLRTRMAGTPGATGLLALRDDLRALTRDTEVRLAAVLPPDTLAACRAYLDQRRQEARARLAAARQGG